MPIRARRCAPTERGSPWTGMPPTSSSRSSPAPLGSDDTSPAGRTPRPGYVAQADVVARRSRLAVGGADLGLSAPLALDHCRPGAPPCVLRRDEASRDRRACTAAGRPRGLGAFEHRRASAPGCMRLGHEPTADCRTCSRAGSTASATSCHCRTSSAVVLKHRHGARTHSELESHGCHGRRFRQS